MVAIWFHGSCLAQLGPLGHFWAPAEDPLIGIGLLYAAIAVVVRATALMLPSCVTVVLVLFGGRVLGVGADVHLNCFWHDFPEGHFVENHSYSAFMYVWN